MTASDEQDRFLDSIERESPDLLRFFARRVGVDAADLLSETMEIAWRQHGRLPADPVQARMWLFGIARNVYRGAARGHVRRQKIADRLREVIELESIGLDAGAREDVRDAIERLDPELAELVTLVHWDGFTIAEAATLQGVPASTARGRYQRARLALRALLSPSAGS